MSRYSLAVVRHHRGSAAIAKCGAEIHDRGNLQLCERAFWGQWRCELLAMDGGKIDLGSLLTKVYLSDIRGRVSDPHRPQPTYTTSTNKKDADLKKSASCAQNRLECRATAFAVVRHHRGSAAVAKCGAEIHDRGNLLSVRGLLGNLAM